MKSNIICGISLAFWFIFTIYLILKVYTQFWEHELDTRVKPYIDERLQYDLCIRGLGWDCPNVTDEMRKNYIKSFERKEK